MRGCSNERVCRKLVFPRARPGLRGRAPARPRGRGRLRLALRARRRGRCRDRVRMAVGGSAMTAATTESREALGRQIAADSQEKARRAVRTLVNELKKERKGMKC